MSPTVNLNTVKMVNTKDTLVIVSFSSEVKIRFSLLPPRGCRTAVREAARTEDEAGLTSQMGQWRGLAVLGYRRPPSEPHSFSACRHLRLLVRQVLRGSELSSHSFFSK